MPRLSATVSSHDLEWTRKMSWENMKKADGMKDRANTMHHLQYYGEEQKRLYQELPFRAVPGMRTRSFRSERDFPQLQPRSSWANLSRLMTKQGEQKPLVADDVEAAAPGYTYPLLVSCLVAVVNSFQYGYNTAVTGALDAAVVFPGHSEFLWALCVSSFAIGGPIGSMASGHLNAQLGRKKTMLVTSCLFVVSGAVMALAINMYMLIFGRFLVGIASGTATVIVPLYLGELAPPNLRGALGTTYQVAMVTGILSTILLAFQFAGESTSLVSPGWRFMFGFAGLVGLVQLVLVPFVVESPRWFLNKGEEKAAAATLRHLRQLDDVFDELDSISAASFSETGDVQGISHVVHDPAIRGPLCVAVTLQLVQQLSGINAVMFYASSFFQHAGLDDPRVGIALVYAVNVLATVVALVLMDIAGRRPLLLASILGMLVSSGVLTLGLHHVLPFGTFFCVGGVMSFVWCFELGLGPIPWLIAAEMFPPQSRTTATSIATMVNWAGLFCIGIGFPTMQRALANYIFVPFALVLAAAFAFTLKVVPETRGKTVDEILAEVKTK